MSHPRSEIIDFASEISTPKSPKANRSLMEIQLPTPEYPVGAKRRKLSPEEEDGDVKQPRARLCIITFSVDDGGLNYDIFVTDLDAAGSKSEIDGFIPIAPTFRLDAEGTDRGFCVLGSTVYIFESTGLLSNSPPLKTVYTIDLLSKPSLKRLCKSELCTIGDMNHPKTSPLATPTPDGKKILTFSAFVRFHPFAVSRETVGENDFELYDLNVGKWHTLPGIPYDWLLRYYRANSSNSNYKRGDLWIGGFTFIGRATFVIQIKVMNGGYDRGTMGDDDNLILSIDLDSMDRGWEQMHTFFGASALPFDDGCFLVVDDFLSVAPDGAYDIKKYQRFPPCVFFPRPCNGGGGDYDDDAMLFRPCAVTLLNDVKNGKVNFCNLEIGINMESMHPHFVINTLTCDLAKYKEDDEKEGESAQLSAAISTGDSFKFHVDEPCDSFCSLGFFSF
ncbi:hypothetical protein OROGR_011104 [Orobanche gracilis]